MNRLGYIGCVVAVPFKVFGNCPGWLAAWSAQLTVAGQGLLGA
jgi:hypothetical protein